MSERCRFASNRRCVWTFEWLTLYPNVAVLPQIAQARGIDDISSGELKVNGTVARIARQCDGATLLRVLEAAALRLERSVDEVNALNVYPVPDGDTGTNMVHTMRSALDHAHAAQATAGTIAAAAAHGALMGARGNSGVILSQVLRGIKEGLAGKKTFTAVDIGRAFLEGRRLAFAAVTAPAPGTMLTLCDAVAGAIGPRTDLGQLLRAALAAGEAALPRTRDENPVNKAAGVVDAGAYGLQLLLEGALSAVEESAATSRVSKGRPATLPRVRQRRTARSREAGKGRPARLPRSGGVLPRRSTRNQRHDDRLVRTPPPSTSPGVPPQLPSWEGAYDVQFLVKSPSRTAEQLRAEMLEFGADCVLVVGDESLVKVHVHTRQPDQIVRIGLTGGRISDVVVEDLDAMTAEHERATGIVVPPPRPQAAVGVVAVVPGDGFAAVARSLGATPLRGGATMNPSTEEILAAVRSVDARCVVVLPNDRNVVLAARQAAQLAERDVRVIPTQNVAQGMAALVAFDPAHPADVVTRAMEEVAHRVHGIEVTRAIRESVVDGERVREGEALALLDGRVVAHGDDEVAALCEAAGRLTDAEVLTLYSGAGVDAARVEYAAQRLRAACPRVAVEIVDGGQPHYSFIVSAE